MINLAYLIFLVYVMATVIKNRQAMLQYGATPATYALLALSLIACTARSALPFCCHGRLLPLLFYPIPLVTLAFIPSILLGRHLTNKYSTAGTSLANDAEKAAANVTWAGGVGIAITLVGWMMEFASDHLSKPY